MKKFKLKEFVIVFLVLMVIQFIIGLAEILLSRANNDLSSLTSIFLDIFSYPISLINSNLPFYVSEDLFMVVIYWIINVIIQSAFVYGFIIVIRKIRSEK
ncbi:hypothetical protein [Winogradskyella forsetii]|uniref:hypothetical protein n=1 Tax=Winogradskyella forsetii TaxID=2686077 RepID=UPI0015BAF9AA|nr:hypothetical protein [Winogradskyella forsetii]